MKFFSRPKPVPPAPTPVPTTRYIIGAHDDGSATLVASFDGPAPGQRAKPADLASMLDRRRGVYRHVKTRNIYKITGFTIDTDTGVMRVSYVRIGGPDYDAIWCPFITYSRRAAEWTGDRFEYLHG